MDPINLELRFAGAVFFLAAFIAVNPWYLCMKYYWHIVQWVYRALCSPLAKLPGPWYTNFTDAAIKINTVKGLTPKYIHSLHEKYGMSLFQLKFHSEYLFFPNRASCSDQSTCGQHLRSRCTTNIPSEGRILEVTVVHGTSSWCWKRFQHNWCWFPPTTSTASLIIYLGNRLGGPSTHHRCEGLPMHGTYSSGNERARSSRHLTLAVMYDNWCNWGT